MYKPAVQIPAEEDFHLLSCGAGGKINTLEEQRALPAKWKKNHSHDLYENEKSYHASAQLGIPFLLTVLHIHQIYKHLFPKIGIQRPADLSLTFDRYHPIPCNHQTLRYAVLPQSISLTSDSPQNITTIIMYQNESMELSIINKESSMLYLYIHTNLSIKINFKFFVVILRYFLIQNTVQILIVFPFSYKTIFPSLLYSCTKPMTFSVFPHTPV